MPIIQPQEGVAAITRYVSDQGLRKKYEIRQFPDSRRRVLKSLEVYRWFFLKLFMMKYEFVG